MSLFNRRDLLKGIAASSSASTLPQITMAQGTDGSKSGMVLEGFENGNVEGWVQKDGGISSLEASQQRARSGSWAAKFFAHEGADNGRPIWERVGTEQKPTTVETAHALGEGKTYADSNTAWKLGDTRVLRVNFNWSNNFIAVNGRGARPSDIDQGAVVADLPWPESNKFFHVVLDQIDWNNFVVGEARVNGTVKATDVPFFNNEDAIDRTNVNIGGHSGNVTFVDDTSVPSGTPSGEPPSPPTAAFSFTPTEPETSQGVTFEAISSTDADGATTKYEWDLDDDGTFERTGETIDYEFSTPGHHTVRLRVTDDRGVTASTSQSFRVGLLYGPEKRDLGDRIDDISITPLNDGPRANATINDLSAAVQTGDLDLQSAEETAERLLLGEEVTERVLEHTGPAKDEFGRDTNLIRDLAEPVMRTAIDLLLGARGAAKSSINQSTNSFFSLGGIGSALKDTATDLLGDAVSRLLDWFFGSFQSGKKNAKQSLTAEVDRYVSKFINNAEVWRGRIQEAKDQIIDVVLDGIVASLRTYFEQGIKTPVNSVTASNIGIFTTTNYLFNNLNRKAASTGLSGTIEGARRAQWNKIGQIDSQIQLVVNDIEKVQDFEEKSDLITAVADLFDEGDVSLIDVFQTLVGLANTVVGSLTSAVSVGMGLQGLIELQIQHSIAAYLIVNGRESL